MTSYFAFNPLADPERPRIRLERSDGSLFTYQFDSLADFATYAKETVRIGPMIYRRVFSCTYEYKVDVELSRMYPVLPDTH